MIDLEGQHVELLPARTTLMGGSLFQTTTGGAGGASNALINANVLSGIGILGEGTANAGVGGAGGDAASVVG